MQRSCFVTQHAVTLGQCHTFPPEFQRSRTWLEDKSNIEIYLHLLSQPPPPPAMGLIVRGNPLTHITYLHLIRTSLRLICLQASTYNRPRFTPPKLSCLRSRITCRSMMWPRGGLLGVCLALLFTLHHGDFAVSSGGPVHGVAAAADVAGAGRYLRASDHGWEHHSHSSAGAAGLHGSIGIGGRKLTELCHTRRCGLKHTCMHHVMYWTYGAPAAGSMIWRSAPEDTRAAWLCV